MIQTVCGCLMRLLKQMDDENPRNSIYAPSYWYAEEIGYIHEPVLEKICLITILNILRYHRKKSSLDIKGRKGKKKKNKSSSKSYEHFVDEEGILVKNFLITIIQMDRESQFLLLVIIMQEKQT